VTDLRAILFDDPAQQEGEDRAADELTRAAERLARAGGIPRQQGSLTEQICRAVLDKVSEELNFDVTDVLIDAWKLRSALLKAAHETYEGPERRQEVVLRTYAIPWNREMDVDVSVNGVHLPKLTLDLSVKMQVTSLAVVVEYGRLTKVDGGYGKVTAVLKVKDPEPPPDCPPIAKREYPFDARYELPIGAGIPLIDGA